MDGKREGERETSGGTSRSLSLHRQVRQGDRRPLARPSRGPVVGSFGED